MRGEKNQSFEIYIYMYRICYMKGAKKKKMVKGCKTFCSFTGAYEMRETQHCHSPLHLLSQVSVSEGVDDCVLSWNTWESLVKLMHFKWKLLHYCHVCHCAHGTAHKIHTALYLSNVNIHSRNVSSKLFSFVISFYHRSLSLILSSSYLRKKFFFQLFENRNLIFLINIIIIIFWLYYYILFY